MKKSRTGVAVLFIGFLIVAFVALIMTLSMLSNEKEETGTWSSILEGGNKIGIVTIEGTIMSSDDILKQLRKYRKKSSIKAVLLRVNSPGGSVAPAQEIYREIARLREKKPVVVSMETVAASAAYYISSNADAIVCSQGTITGSIGVIMILPEIHQIIQRVGADVNIIKAGKYKDIGSITRPLTEEERGILNGFAAEIHEQFISDVARGRKGKIEEQKLREIADGRFFTGEKAKEWGLVDDIGNFYDAVKVAAKLGKIKTEPELVYPKKKWDNLLDVFMESAASAVVKVVERTRALQAPTIQ
ncbi:signal peptide peptidase SppA [Desulfomonile tiedjei]|uniref:Signal peptide peptidase A n=1 Tax=Desulfomonile tiedjei (strain ATCC 49306 / DSM 6799 / DCB-1) TaxID=706587 RepID=I4CCF4_DESTA|nr:signal peptide peptidase SppA [Desulfomonile tiedjei]AFM27245.1 signal peptide peptidase A [Desulfomonile tiedjei DSM 6799]